MLSNRMTYLRQNKRGANTLHQLKSHLTLTEMNFQDSDTMATNKTNVKYTTAISADQR